MLLLCFVNSSITQFLKKSVCSPLRSFCTSSFILRWVLHFRSIISRSLNLSMPKSDHDHRSFCVDRELHSPLKTYSRQVLFPDSPSLSASESGVCQLVAYRAPTVDADIDGWRILRTAVWGHARGLSCQMLIFELRDASASIENYPLRQLRTDLFENNLSSVTI